MFGRDLAVIVVCGGVKNWEAQANGGDAAPGAEEIAGGFVVFGGWGGEVVPCEGRGKEFQFRSTG